MPDSTGEVVSESEIGSPYEVILINGVAYDYNGNRIVSDAPFITYGKLSWATKALKAAWNKLPGWAQGALGVTGFAKLLDFVDHFTGTVEEAVYEGCKMLGMNDTMANAVTKVLLFLAL